MTIKNDARDQSEELSRYTTQAGLHEAFFKESLESALGWLESDIRAIRASLEANTNTFAESVVAHAARVQDAAVKYRLHGENHAMLKDILSAEEPEAEVVA